jgi:hypothetical protein
MGGYNIGEAIDIKAKFPKSVAYVRDLGRATGFNKGRFFIHHNISCAQRKTVELVSIRLNFKNLIRNF